MKSRGFVLARYAYMSKYFDMPCGMEPNLKQPESLVRSSELAFNVHPQEILVAQK